MRNNIIHGAENFGLEPKHAVKSRQEYTMDQVLDICNRVYELVILRHEEGVCHNQEVQCEQAALQSDSTLRNSDKTYSLIETDIIHKP